MLNTRYILTHFKKQILNNNNASAIKSQYNQSVYKPIGYNSIFYKPSLFEGRRYFSSFNPYDEYGDEIDHFSTTFDYDVEVSDGGSSTFSNNSFNSTTTSTNIENNKPKKRIKITMNNSTLNSINMNNNNVNNMVTPKIKVKGKTIKSVDNESIQQPTLLSPIPPIESINLPVQKKEKEKKSTTKEQEELDNDHPLTSEQEKIVNLIVEGGKNVFFTGSAGTGKSFVLKHLVARLREKFPKSVFVTAATGIAAVNIGGTTLHSFAGIHLGTATAEKLAANIIKKKKYLQRWRDVKVLVIDEISMIDSELFEKLNTIGKIIRGNQLPFGGIQLVLVGDFFQLPPVLGSYTFESPQWESCIDMCLELTTVMRQKEIEFINVLNSIRVGRVHDGIVKSLQQCARPLDVSNGVLPTKLYTTNQSVDDENTLALGALTGEPKVYESFDSGHKDMIVNLDNDCPAPKSLTLKVGAQVVLLRKLEKNDTLVNGSRGVVVDFVKVRAKKRFAKFYQDNPMAPVVLFNDGQKVTIPPMEWGVWSENKASRVQLPLKLAWALTIHRAQGMTLDKVECQLSQSFACGQGYVALSRVRSLSGLYLRDFKRTAIRTSSKVIQFNKKINKLSG
ncbi:DNA helicase [Tieghemostelium lacteum]|uniref:ATP-dependent DNA helicase PIF1 n=1 Tax=Tieghemostelium lacteum TaxID=361077 RepID=A0A151ZIE5_TIELA|nr:DNA helicase [Tieghemostelium lacteum]|eukprot:KYQ93685.1 DNA helicase [Tieghemostelium lacteum]